MSYLPPWIITKPHIDLTLIQQEKTQLTTLSAKNRFKELRDKYSDYTAFFTDGTGAAAININNYKCYIHTDAVIKMQEDFFIKICTSHFIVRVRKGYSRFYGERELETEHNCNILTPTLMAVSVVSFSFSWCSTRGPGVPRVPSTGLSLLHLISNFSGPQLIRGSKCPCGLVWLSLPHLISNFSNSNCLTSVLTELYNSSMPTQSLEWHVWSSSSRNNCHAVHRSLSSGASLWSGTFTLSHIISRAYLRDFLS